ncbi:MAG: hypothetical protein NZ739_02960 [Verrucomicrobiae bacterium]|nr:hypothetical protein [Verrucomicrobiae bacterium]
MRFRSSKWFIFAGLIAGGVLLYPLPGQIRQWVNAHRFRWEGFEEAFRSEVYLVETDRWLQFDVPDDATLARLISNASVKSIPAPRPGAWFNYAIEYQVVNADGETIETGVRHFKGEHLVFRHAKTKQIVPANYFLEPHLVPLSGGHWVINFADPTLAGARTLRLRLHSHHPEIVEVAVRLYFRKTVPQRKVAYLWNRLSASQKRSLARGNVYSHEGLNAWEKFCLLRYHWPASAPPGIPGRDFRRRTIFIRDDWETLQLVTEWVPAGVPVDEAHFGLFPLTNAPGTYLLEMLKYPPGPDVQVIANSLSWRGWALDQAQTVEVTWSGTNHVLVLTNRHGLLRVGSSAPLYLRLLLAEGNRTNDVTPEPLQLLTFTCSGTNPVTYAVEHVDESRTLFRVDLRRPVPVEEEARLCRVQFALLDRDGNAVKTGVVSLTNAVTPYDWLHTRNGLRAVTEPLSLCFVLPHQVRSVRIAAEAEPVLVNAYSRPAGLPRRLRLPEDYFPGAIAPAQPSWFTVRPPDQVQRRAAGQTCVVRVQPRFPEVDPMLSAGAYEWVSFTPRNLSHGHMLLVPAREGAPVRASGLPHRFVQVPVNTTNRVVFCAAFAETHIEPSLIVFCTNEPGPRVSVSLNGQTVFDGLVPGSVAELRLGRLAPGGHELCVAAPESVYAYVNYLDVFPTPAYWRRFCAAATTNTIWFTYKKESADTELLVLRIFSPLQANTKPYQVRVKLHVESPRQPGPFPEVTFLEREAYVTPVQSGRASMVSVPPYQLDEGQAVFVPVGPDVPPGQYELEVHLDAVLPRWVLLSRVTPGVAEKLVVTLEPRD